MSLRQRITMIFATVASLLVHGLVFYEVMNLSLSLAPESRLFAQSPEDQQLQPMRVFRATRDEIVDEGSSTEPTIATPKPSDEAQQLRDQTKKLLDAADQAKPLKPKAVDNELAGGGDPRVEAPAPKGASVKPGAPSQLDTTRRLLALAQPSIKLPQYVGPTDQVDAPAPGDTPIDAGATINTDQLHQLDRMLGGPGGSGTGIASAAPGSGGDGHGGSPSGPATPGTNAPDKAELPAAPQAPKVAMNLPKTPLVPKLPPLPVPKIETPKTTAPNHPKPIHLDEDFTYTLTKYWAPPRKVGGFLGIGTHQEQDDAGWFRVTVTPRRSLRKLKALHKDVVWVIDTSGSIRQQWVDAVKKGIAGALDTLNPGDRFNIVMFKDTVSVFAPNGLIALNDNTADSARRFLSTAQSGGDTDVNRALSRLIVRDSPPDRVYQLVLITDGVPTSGMIDARRIINLITRENDLVASIFCIGIGDKINHELLEFLAYRNKGFVVYPTGIDDADAAVRELAGRLRYPLVKGATVDTAGVDPTTVYPRIPRDIYQGESLSLFGRYNKGTQQVSMRLTGVNGPEVLDFTFTLPFEKASNGDEALAKRWAFWKLHHLYSEVIRQGQTDAIKQQMDDLRNRYDLKIAY